MTDSTAGNSSKASTEISAQALAVGAHCSWTSLHNQEKGHKTLVPWSTKAPRLALLPASPQYPGSACSRTETDSKMLKEIIRNCPGYASWRSAYTGRERMKGQCDSVNNIPENRTLEECNASAHCPSKRGNSRWLNPLPLTMYHWKLFLAGLW